MDYVDGFLIPIKKDKVDAYREMATRANKYFMDHGALACRECLMEDGHNEWGPSFKDAASAESDETVFFSYIVYRDRAHRDEVNKKVMEDPRMKAEMEGDNIFDCKRMAYGGFEAVVSYDKE